MQARAKTGTGQMVDIGLYEPVFRILDELAPAFDVTYSFQPDGKWTSTHQMTLNGKRDGFTPEDFQACAEAASMKRTRAEAILKEITAVVARWPDYADDAGVSADWRDRISTTLRVGGFV